MLIAPFEAAETEITAVMLSKLYSSMIQTCSFSTADLRIHSSQGHVGNIVAMRLHLLWFVVDCRRLLDL